MSKQGFVLRGFGLAACFVVAGAVAVHAGETSPRPAPRPIVSFFAGQVTYVCAGTAGGIGAFTELSRSATVKGGLRYSGSAIGHFWTDAAGSVLGGRVVRTQANGEDNVPELVIEIVKGIGSTASPAPTPTAPPMSNTTRVRMLDTQGGTAPTGACKVRGKDRGATGTPPQIVPFAGEFHFIAE